jgi:hypothetical protein
LLLEHPVLPLRYNTYNICFSCFLSEIELLTPDNSQDYDEIDLDNETKEITSNQRTEHKPIKYVAGRRNPNDMYAIIDRPSETNAPEIGSCNEPQLEDQTQDLPPGWEKLEDTYSLPYYRHTKTGATQRETPTWEKKTKTPETAIQSPQNK